MHSKIMAELSCWSASATIKKPKATTQTYLHNKKVSALMLLYNMQVKSKITIVAVIMTC